MTRAQDPAVRLCSPRRESALGYGVARNIAKNTATAEYGDPKPFDCQGFR